MGVLRRSLHASVADGGRLLVIDFEPSLDRLIRDFKGAGFQLVRTPNAGNSRRASMRHSSSAFEPKLNLRAFVPPWYAVAPY